MSVIYYLNRLDHRIAHILYNLYICVYFNFAFCLVNLHLSHVLNIRVAVNRFLSTVPKIRYISRLNLLIPT